ncbi:MAG: hypothetical protein ACRDZ4_09485 [Egibacteraceae bacterium]
MVMNRIDTPHPPAQLVSFRQALYGCLDGWADTLFELTDAALCSPGPVNSVPHLSLEPVFRRSHPSLYKALARRDRRRGAAPGPRRPPAIRVAGGVRGGRLHLGAL